MLRAEAAAAVAAAAVAAQDLGRVGRLEAQQLPRGGLEHICQPEARHERQRVRKTRGGSSTRKRGWPLVSG